MRDRANPPTLAGVAKGIQAAFSLVRDAAKAKEKPGKPRGRIPIGEAAAAGRLIEVLPAPRLPLFARYTPGLAVNTGGDMSRLSNCWIRV
jgi:hypothetical protein